MYAVRRDRRVHTPPRRGLTLLELILATTITTMVASAIAAMLSAVANGVGSRNDTRAAIVRANAAQARVTSYVMSSKCFLDVYANNGVALWLNDSRRSGTVHATEIRWVLLDGETNSLNVYFVKFPDDWTQAAKDLADVEYAATANWINVLATYQAADHIEIVPLVDAISRVHAVLDDNHPMEALSLYLDLQMQTDSGAVPARVAGTIRYHEEPTS